ncbi:lateral signaling target protein 2 homolog isoform X2 [Ornithorhynchus anatinus]|uniref:lateral signaling target protein 2 homolog isoform X2 n=1 Tax=Ornithorhynchus anatinus TaxID=9258 RepID=UPI0010A8296F|nr:lateral signaling target protein 2 homolog isoform X2 [Ornithorhynchus anatinus]
MLPAAVRKWLNRPKRSDPRLLAQFFFADERVNEVVAEIVCLDVRAEPQLYLVLLSQLHSSQEHLLAILEQVMQECIPQERASRDYLVKFPEDLVAENLGPHVLFAAECLVAGSFVEVDEAAGVLLRPLARELLLSLERVRDTVREAVWEQRLSRPGALPDPLRRALLRFDGLFADFQLSYVSTMAVVKSPEEIYQQQDIAVLFCEAVARALKLGYLTQEMIDSYEPQLMLTIPRLAILSGLLIYPDGPLSLRRPPEEMASVFSPFYPLLKKIQALLRVLSEEELALLERSLCAAEEAPQTGPRAGTSPGPSATGRHSWAHGSLRGAGEGPPPGPAVSPRSDGRSPGTRTDAKAAATPPTETQRPGADRDPCPKRPPGNTGRSEHRAREVSVEPGREAGGCRRPAAPSSGRLGGSPLSPAERRALRARYTSPQDMVHTLFVCISGVADQLQTNFASDLRAILQTVFLVVASKPEAEPPAWVPDSSSPCCRACRAPFTFLRRRHHCRSCGQIFCSRCSSHSAPLPQFGHVKPVRVCSHCYATHLAPGCS